MSDWVPTAVQSHVRYVESAFNQKPQRPDPGSKAATLMAENGITFEDMLQVQADEFALLHRVATETRMLYVWRELSQCGATDEALVEFFDCAFQRARFPHPITTPKDRVALAAPWAQAAELCRWSGEHQIRAKMIPELKVALLLVADHFEEVAQTEQGTTSPLTVKHHNADDPIRAYVRVLGAFTQRHFHSPLYRTVATTASVALQKEIDWNQVRHWLTP
jgi:hypothetical protein